MTNNLSGLCISTQVRDLELARTTIRRFVESRLLSCHDGAEDWIAVPKQLPPDELARTSTITLAHYNEHADSFWHGTRDHDVSQNRDALLESLHGPAPLRILDFGCGPGRDLKFFHDLGHEVIGLEGAARFVDLARAYSGCEVWLQDFLKLDLPAEFFDGIFANASLFHVPSQELPRVLRELVGDIEDPAACSSVPIRAAKTRKAGTASAMAATTIGRTGARS